MKNKKHLVRWLSLLLIVVAVIGITLVSAKEPTPQVDGLVLEDMPIVLPSNVTEVEKTAAKELQAYLKKMTGTNSSILTEGVQMETAIYLGATKFAKENNVTYTDKNNQGEGWAIKVIGNNLVLTGGDVRGSLYAVYHLLEDVFGVRWWNMWEEYVPELEHAVVAYDLDLSGEPVFADRGIYSNEGLSTLYYVRNRLNGWVSNAPQEYGGEINFARPYHVHTFDRFFPPFYNPPTSAADAVWYDLINPEGISYFDEHPEWFSWSDERQERTAFGQMCLSNKELLEAFKEKILLAIELSYKDADKAGKNRPEYIDVSPNDTGGHCECDECEASMAASGNSGHLFKFVNAIADAVAEVYPEMKVETLAYSEYFEVPLDDTVPRDNVVIRLASNDMSMMHGLDHPLNKRPKERLEEWGKLLKHGQLIYWDYGINSTDGVFPNYFRYAEDWQKVYENAGVGVFLELQNFNETELWDVKHWVNTKLMEDPYQDVYELTRTFLKGYYGEAAAGYIFDYMVKMEELGNTVDFIVRYSTKIVDVPWLTAQDVKWSHLQFEAAVAATEADPDLTAEEKELFIKRINAGRASLDRTIINNYNKFVDEMYAAGELFDISKRETGLRMMESTKWMFDMELTDDHTGDQDPLKRIEKGGGKNLLTKYAQYIGEEDIVNGGYLERPEIPQQIFDDHPGIDERHIYDYTNSSLWDASYYQFGFEYVSNSNDSSYEGGTSVVWDLRKLASRNDSGELGISDKRYYTFSENKALYSSLKTQMYIGDPIIADGEWHLYRAKDEIIYDEGSDDMTFFAGTLKLELAELEHLTGDPVDVYFSLKVEGDVSGENPKTYGKFYVDRIIIVEDCSGHNVNYTGSIPATCSSNEILTGICPVCGQEARKEVPGTKLSHTFSGAYVFDADAGVYKADCAVCGEVEYTNIKAQLPDDVLASLTAEGTELDKVYDFSTREFYNGGVDGVNATTGGRWWALLDDPDSVMGKAYFWNLNEMNAAGTGSVGYFDMTSGIRTSGNKIPKPLKAADVITDGQYHYYKMEDIDLFAGDDSRLIFFDWTLQVDFKTYPQLRGKKVDMYLSLKVEGDMDYTTPGQMPKYYIDRIIIAENCSEHTTDNLTFDAAASAYVGTCAKCGKEIRYEVKNELPQEILDAVAAADSSLAHVYDYAIDDFWAKTNVSYQTRVEDSASALGEAFRYDSNRMNASVRNSYFIFSGSKEFTLTHQLWQETCEPLTGITAAELNANSGDGQYHLYKISGVIIPRHLNYLWCLGYNIQHRFNDVKAALQGLDMDMYVSMKIEGDVTGSDSKKLPVYYIDRMILVDTCANHTAKEDLELISEATCYQGEIWRGQCFGCGKISNMEMEETRKPHKYGEYVYDAVTGNQYAYCQNDGCTEFKVLVSKGELPQEIKDDLVAQGIGMEHVHDYTANEFSLSEPFALVQDADSPVGVAARASAWEARNPSWVIMGSDRKWPIILYQSKNEHTVGTLTYDMLKPNENKGYVVYKFEDFTVPEGNFNYLHTFDYRIQHRSLPGDLKKLTGKTVDFYLSMKIEGKIDNYSDKNGGPIWYVDRMVIVDSCENYEITYHEPENVSCGSGPVTLTGYCPVCNKEKTKEGTSQGGHKFGWYYQVDEGDTYRAECIYGCGATDFRYAQKLTVQEKLPAELPQSVKNHIVVSYSIGDFYLSGDPKGVRWDHDLNRPVGVREYDTTLSASSQYGLNTSGGLIACMYKAGIGGKGIGTFKGTEIMANAGDGKYHLYSVKGTVPMKEESYNYMYMFTDWVLQCRMVSQDLRDYRNEMMDLYLYMKVDGDPSCAGEEKPIYYIDQIIFATSCQVDETWTINKEATCTAQGEATGDCAICGAKGITTGIPQIPHDIDPLSLTYKEPTCETNRWVHGVCKVCGGTFDQEVPGTMLEHSFSNYVKSEDGSGKEIAYCDNGCGERHIRNSVSTGENIQLPEPLQPIIPILGGAAGGSSFGFSDIKESDWYFESVKEAWSNKLINGVTATEFRPNETLTVAQAVKLASAYHEMNYTGDVTLENGSGNWYSSYVDYAVENGIIDSKYASKSTAEMNKAIDRSEFVSIFVKAMDEGSLVGYNDVADNAIPDVKTDDENADAIYKFYRAGILTGSDSKGTFNPTSSIKRSEVAAILSRMYNENVRQAITLK